MGNPREYAGHWHINNDEAEKALREVGVLMNLIESSKMIGDDLDLHHPAINVEDPPGCMAFTATGEPVGIEITELVDWRHLTFDKRQRQEGRTKVWTPEEFQELLHARILSKDGKSYKGGPYVRLVLLIHTDEWGLDHQIEKLLDRSLLPELKQLDEVYLLQSHDPGLGRYPYFRLL